MNASTAGTRVAVLGLGYVGSVTAACLAHLGHSVIGVDRDAHKVKSIECGKAPFYEPGLAELIEEGRANGRLTATTLLEPAIEQADIALICVGTPSERNGNLGLDQLRRVCSQIATAWTGPGPPLNRGCAQHGVSRHLRGVDRRLFGRSRSVCGGVEPGIPPRRQRRERFSGAFVIGRGRSATAAPSKPWRRCTGRLPWKPAWSLCERRR